jgi:hypothetical protein
MSVWWKAAGWTAIVVFTGAGLAAVLLLRFHKKPSPVIFLQGAVVRQESDTKKESPVADVHISAANGLAASECVSDDSGFFRLPLRPGVQPGQPVTLRFRRPEYQPFDLNDLATDKLYVVRLIPIPRQTYVEPARAEVVLSNVRIRYSMKSTTVVNVGSAVKTFQVSNKGNVPCGGHQPCSPDGRWRAAIGSASLEAEQEYEFHNARFSCIAGPCPFTKVERNGRSQDSRSFRVSVLNWSDTVTFLLEAEVVRPMITDIVRDSYPVIFGQTFNFALPAEAEGVTIQAEINKTTIVFPLGPSLLLSWAECSARVNPDHTTLYTCELKPGYRFPDSPSRP